MDGCPIQATVLHRFKEVSYVRYPAVTTVDALMVNRHYNSMMMQYVETMSALEDIDESELSDEETLYYAEVMLRINQKLLGAM